MSVLDTQELRRSLHLKIELGLVTKAFGCQSDMYESVSIDIPHIIGMLVEFSHITAERDST